MKYWWNVVVFIQNNIYNKTYPHRKQCSNVKTLVKTGLFEYLHKFQIIVLDVHDINFIMP